MTSGTAAVAAGPRLGVIYDCAFPPFIVDDHEQDGIVFGKQQRYRYGTEVKHKRLPGKIRRARYKVDGKFYDKPAIKFLTDPANPTDVGIWGYQVGSKGWRDREKQQREDG